MSSEYPTRKIVRIGNSYRITVPSDMVKGFGWGEGTKLKFKAVGYKKIEISEG